MKVCDLAWADLRSRLRRPGLDLVSGPFCLRIHSPLRSVCQGIATLYPEFPVMPVGGFADFHVAVQRAGGLRRWYRPQVVFRVDGQSTFKPLPLHQAFPMLEWGLNWCVTTQVQHYLLFHAAVVAKGGRAVVMPGAPGAGKSTLCAGLVARGWRLLSDELALVDLETGTVTGLARPVSLKNESIDVIRDLAPDAFVSEPCHDTLKGSVAHMRPPSASVGAMQEPAAARWLVFPRFEAGAATAHAAVAPEQGLFRLLGNAFNYSALGALAFERSVDLVAGCTCHDFTYGRLGEAVAVFDAWAAGAAQPAH